MNITVIFAGGTGQRMSIATKPKQFLELHGKPIIVYTLEKFQKHPEIDGIIVVCLASWIDYCKELVAKYGLTKVSAVIAGGETGQQSIYNGLAKTAELYDENSVVLIHDGVRPLVAAETITNAIACAKENGSAVVVSPAIETIAVKSETAEVKQIMDRSSCQLVKAPQCFVLKDILSVHKQAKTEGKENDFIDSASLMRNYGHKVYTVEGAAENIKITTPIDFYMFKAIIDAQENSDVFGAEK